MGIEYNRMRVLKGKDNLPNSCVDMRVPPKMGILGASLLGKERKERKNARQSEVTNISIQALGLQSHFLASSGREESSICKSTKSRQH